MLKSFKITNEETVDDSTPLIKDVLSVLFFSVLTALSANIKINIGIIPVTMQTLAVLLSGLYLGSKKGTYSQITYLMMGILGVPWFSMGGGLAYILSPTFGYLLGFIPASYIVGKLTENNYNILLSLIMGTLVIYFFGILWLSRMFGLLGALNIGLYPFILGDTLKILIAIIIKNIRK